MSAAREQLDLLGVPEPLPSADEKVVPVRGSQPHTRRIRTRPHAGHGAAGSSSPLERKRADSLDSGLARRDAGVKRVAVRLTPEERVSLRNYISVASDHARIPLLGGGLGFTSDDTYELLPEGLRVKMGKNPNAFGGAHLGAARRDLIRSTGQFAKSRRSDARGRNIVIWQRVRR